MTGFFDSFGFCRSLFIPYRTSLVDHKQGTIDLSRVFAPHLFPMIRALTFLLLISHAVTSVAGSVEIAPAVSYYAYGSSDTPQQGPYEDEATAINAVLPSWVKVYVFPSHTRYYDYPEIVSADGWVKSINGFWSLTKTYHLRQKVRYVFNDGRPNFEDFIQLNTRVLLVYRAPNCYGFKQNWTSWNLGEAGPSCIQTVNAICDKCETNGYSVGNPIQACSQTKQEVGMDFQGAGAFPLEFRRRYDSTTNPEWTRHNSIGTRWRHNYGHFLKHYSSQSYETVHVYRDAVAPTYFTLTNGIWTADSDSSDTLTKSATGWSLTQSGGTVENYDSLGRLVSIRRPGGQTQTLTYYPADENGGRLYQVSDSSGQTLTLAYDSNGRPSTLTDSTGQVVRYSYDANSNLARVDYPDMTAKVYHYENTNFPSYLTGTSFVDSAGAFRRHSTFGYDSVGRATLTQYPDIGNGGPQQKYILERLGITRSRVTDAVGTQELLNFQINLGRTSLLSKENLTDNKSLTQTFDPNNNLSCKKDEEGRVVTYTYNTTNQKTSETVGQTGTCSSPVATPATRTTTYQYLSPTLDLPTVTESPSVYGTSKKQMVIGYTNNLPTTITQSGFSPTGTAVSRTVTLSYNTSGQVTSIDGPRTDVSDVTTLTYNDCTTGGGCGQLRSVTNALGQRTNYDSYDANGRLLRMTDPNGLVTVYTYDARGRVATLTQTAAGGGGGRVTSYSYDAAGNVVSTTLPTGLVLTYTYDAALNLRRVLDSLGNYIDYGYDLKGNRTQTYTYDATGTLVRTVDLAFNARNRVSQLNAGGSITKQVFDAVGNLTAVTDPNTVALGGSAATSNGYDALNRLLSSVDLLAGVTQYSYDPSDRLKTVQAANGSVTQYQYDDLGNLLKEISPDRGTLSYSYDSAGNLLSQTDARSITVVYTYDALNRLTRMDYPGTTEDVTYTYDSGSGCSAGVGRLCTVVDESGSTGYGYDGFGNVLTAVHTELGVAYTTRYTYDAGNRVTSITYPNGRVVSTPRDVLGRIGSVATTVNGAAVTLSANRTYRPDGLLLSHSAGNGINEVRQYNTQGQLKYQSVGTADTRLYEYDANGNLKSLQSLPLVGTYDYDLLDRLKLDQRTTTATTSSTFTYDPNGNRKTENAGTYSYVANTNRLSTTPAGSILLDAAGNTTSDGSRTYTYNNAGHLSSVAGAGYSYNAKRQRTRKIVGSVGTVYHYDLAGNLLAETDTAGITKRSYVWADGQPLAQIEPTTTLPADMLLDNTQAAFTGTWGTSTSIAGYYGTNYRTNTKGTGKDKAVWNFTVPSTGTYQVSVRHVAASSHASNAPFTVKYSGGSQTISVNQRSSNGVWVVLGSYTFSSATAGSVTLTDNANGTVIADAVKVTAITGGTTSEAVRYLHGDHQGTPRLATNASGVKVWSWEGEACGATQPTGSVTINLRFPGQYHDAESGLHYNHHRYYDPKLCRYLTVDPISVGKHAQRAHFLMRFRASGRPLELNPYAYVANNPLRWVDPFGLEIIGTWREYPTVQLDAVSVTFTVEPPLVWGWGAIRGSVNCVDTCTNKKWVSPINEGLPVTSLGTVTLDEYYDLSPQQRITRWQNEFEFENASALADVISRGETFWCKVQR